MKIQFKYWVGALALLLAVNVASAQKIDRSKAPKAGPAPKINIGKAQSFTLDNGLKVIVVEDHKLPRVAFQLTLDKAPTQEMEAAGYVSMVGPLLRKGSEKYSKDQINEAVDFIGANFSAYSSGFFASSLTKHSEKLLEVVADVILNPTFPEEELEKAKKEQLSGLAASKVDPDAISQNVAQVLRYGNKHPYGEVVTEETVKNIEMKQIKAYYNTYFKPNIGYMIVVGDIDMKKAKAMVSKYFGKWEKGVIPAVDYPTPTAPEQTEVALVDKPGAVQSVITITHPVQFSASADDYIPATVMNTLLGGGGFAGRLMQNIREDKGYTYGAYSSLSADRYVGSFTASAKVRNEVTDSATVEFMKEINRIRDEKATVEEVDLIKRRMAGAFARSLESPQTIARFALNQQLYKLPEDYYQSYLKRLSSVTPADVQSAAKKYVKPENAHILIVGSAGDVAEKMEKFGPVNRYGVYGEPVKAVANTKMTAEEVVAKNVKAVGMEKVKDIYTVFTAPMPMGVLEFSLAMKPGKKAIVQKLNGQAMSKQLITETGMMVKSPMGEQKIEGKDFEAKKYMAIMYPEMDYAKNGYSIKLLDAIKVNGKTAYQVEITNPEGQKEIQSFDAESGLLVKNSSAVAGDQLFSDYKEVEGVMVPHKMVITTPQGNLEFTLKEVKVNKGIEDSMFE